MSHHLILQRVARREHDEAADYYEQSRRGRGGRFTAAVGEVLADIAANPGRYPLEYRDVWGAAVPAVRRVLPGARPSGHRISVFHTSRETGIWQGRA